MTVATIANGESGASVRGKLNALVVARSGPPLIGCFGDSISFQNTKAATGVIMESFSSIGYLTQAVALLKGRVKFRNDLNLGVSGDNTTAMVARLAAALASEANIMCVMGGTNDVAQLVSFSTITTNLQTVYDALLDAGKTVIAIPILPRSGWSGSTDVPLSRRTILRVNAWIRRYAMTVSRRDFFVADADTAMMNWSSTTGDPIANTTYDGLHPMSRGAQLVSGAIFPILDRLLPPRNDRIFSQYDTYNATDNPTGAINDAPVIITTGSVAASGAGITGTIPAGFSVARNIGSTFTATASIEALTGDNGGHCLKLDLGASGAGASTERIRVFQQETINLAGATVYAEIEVDQAALTNVQYISLQVLDADGVTSLQYFGLHPFGNTADREGATMSRIIRTPEFVVAPYAGSGTQSLTIYMLIDADCTTAPSGTIRLKSMAIRKVS